jgi:hypothetical protein
MMKSADYADEEVSTIRVSGWVKHSSGSLIHLLTQVVLTSLL